MAAVMKGLVTVVGNTALVSDVPVPEPSANEIRVKVHSIALNPIDSLYVAHPVAPPGRVVGSDIAGIVDKIGPQVKDWAVGDRVAGFLQGATSANPRPGGFAEYAILESDLAIRIPSGVSFEDAATLPLCSLTAAQALFIRLGMDAPFPNPSGAETKDIDPPTLLVYSAATAIGLFAIELAKASRTRSGQPYRVFATASTAHHAKLRSLGVEAVFDYRSPSWPDEVRKASGGISAAFDCISEDESTAKISQTFGPSGGTIAAVRKSAWSKDGIRPDVTPIYSAVWWGLGHEIQYNDESMPAKPGWRQMAVNFFRYLSDGRLGDASHFPIGAIPVRLMPGGLERVVPDGFTLLGTGKVIDRGSTSRAAVEPWMKPIRGEKLVYHIDD